MVLRKGKQNDINIKLKFNGNYHDTHHVQKDQDINLKIEKTNTDMFSVQNTRKKFTFLFKVRLISKGQLCVQKNTENESPELTAKKSARQTARILR